MAVKTEEYIPNATEKPRVKITSDKFKAEFTVSPAPGGYVMYRIETSAGKLPQALSGLYTRMEEAVKAVTKYEHAHPGSRHKKMEEKREEWAKERDAATVRRSNPSDVHSGADNGEIRDDLSGERLDG